MTTQLQRWTAALINNDQPFDSNDTHWIATATAEEIRQLLQEIAGLAPISDSQVHFETLRSTLELLPVWTAHFVSLNESESFESGDAIANAYQCLEPFENLPRQNLLTVLTTLGGKKNLNFFCELILNSSPNGTTAATIPFLPLFRNANAKEVFPKLLEGISNPDLAPAILDLANFLTRNQHVASHPMADRVTQLVVLLEGLIIGLENLQTKAEEQSETEPKTHQRYTDSIALAISLCDAMALTEDRSTIPVLNKLLELRHRRLRIEAAAALARLGEQNGQQAIKELAAEPSIRLRVLKYAEELDLTDTIDQSYRDPVAVAEAEMVTYLSEPTAMGVPPTSCELIDCLTQYWPGYEEPRICYLFRFTYAGLDAQKQPTSYSNIGIAGPLTQSLRADLGNLPVTDIYAAFAGWQTEHDEIYEIDFRNLDAADHQLIDKISQKIEDSDFVDIVPEKIGKFFGDSVLIANARKMTEDSYQLGVVIGDKNDFYWYPQQASRSIDCDTAYNIYKGKRLLETFN